VVPIWNWLANVASGAKFTDTVGGGCGRVVKDVTVKPSPTSTGLPVTQVGLADALNEPGMDEMAVGGMVV